MDYIWKIIFTAVALGSVFQGGRGNPTFFAGATLGSFVSKYINLPYFHIKKTQSEKIDYPLLTVCALKYDGKIRIAFSGLGGYPFGSYTTENIINDNTLTNEDKANQIFINLFSL